MFVFLKYDNHRKAPSQNVFTTPDEVSVRQEKVLQFLKREEKSLALLEFLTCNQ